MRTTGSLHHVELWVPDLPRATAEWGWLLGALGYAQFQDWPAGRSWNLGGTYLVVEQSTALSAGSHDRLRPGLNHLAFHAGGRGDVDKLAAEGPAHGWTLLFPDKHPFAGGPEHYAAYLANGDGFEVELVAEDESPHVITLIRSATLSDVAEYAYAATAPAGSRLIFLAGACPLNEDGSTAAVGDYAGQAAKAFANMVTALADAGASVQDVISTRVLVASSRQEDLVAAWQVVRDRFGEHDVPSTLMGVTVLGYADQLVELEAVAAVVDSPG